MDTVTSAPDDGWRYHPKHVERFTDINKLYIVASWTIIGIHGTYTNEECPVSNFAQSLATCPDIQRQINVNFLNYASILRTLLTMHGPLNVKLFFLRETRPYRFKSSFFYGVRSVFEPRPPRSPSSSLPIPYMKKV